MAKKDVTAIVSGAGWIASFADKLIKALREKGVSDEQIHKLVTEDGDVPVAKIADMLAGIINMAPGCVRLLVDYTRPLAEMIKDCGFDSVNLDITEKRFPINRRPNGEVEMKIFHFNRFIESGEVIREMGEEYRPAELPEGLAYAKANPDEQRKYSIVILGSVWRDFSDDRDLPCLRVWDGRRGPGLGWYVGGWHSDARFLAVRKS